MKNDPEKIKSGKDLEKGLGRKETREKDLEKILKGLKEDQEGKPGKSQKNPWKEGLGVRPGEA